MDRGRAFALPWRPQRLVRLLQFPGCMDRHVLIVEDNLAALEALSETLSTGGWHVDTAATHVDAEGFLDTRRYDLVITDLSLSGAQGREGFALAAHVRNTQASAMLVLVTAHADDRAENEATSIGIQMVLPRPVALDHVARIADRMVKAAAP